MIELETIQNKTTKLSRNPEITRTIRNKVIVLFEVGVVQYCQ